MLKTQLVEVSGAKRDPFPSPRTNALAVCARNNNPCPLYMLALMIPRATHRICPSGRLVISSYARLHARAQKATVAPRCRPKGARQPLLLRARAFFMICYNNVRGFAYRGAGGAAYYYVVFVYRGAGGAAS